MDAPEDSYPSLKYPRSIVDTSDILVDDVNLINPELALVYGPFSLQSEYFQALLAADAADDRFAVKWYHIDSVAGRQALDKLRMAGRQRHG